MKPVVEFVKTTVTGGILFLIPLVIGLVFLRHAFEFARRIAEPLASFLPVDRIAGVVVADLIAGIGVLAVAFLFGLIARTRLGTGVMAKLERLVLHRMPGYTLLKNISAKADANHHIDVALVHFSDRLMLGFVMDRLDNGLLAVFLPSAPTPTSGTIYFMDAARVQRLDIKLTEAMQCIMQLGSGAGELLRGVDFNSGEKQALSTPS